MRGIRSELIGIVNYGIIGLIQLHLGYSDSEDITVERALDLYDKYMTETKELMYAKIMITTRLGEVCASVHTPI